MTARSVLLAVALVIIAVVVYRHLNQPIDAGIRLINRSADSHELAKVDQAKPELNDKVGGDDRVFGSSLKEFGTADGMRRNDRNSAVARARGEIDSRPQRYLHASQHSWLPTDISVHECIKLSSSGQIRYGTYPAGPEGIKPETMEAWNRQSFETLNKDRRTLMAGVPWGALIGQTCKDVEGANCSAPFFIGESRHVSPNQVAPGKLWVIVNGFVSGSNDFSLLLGIKHLTMSDYNAYEGGYAFDVAVAPPAACGL